MRSLFHQDIVDFLVPNASIIFNIDISSVEPLLHAHKEFLVSFIRNDTYPCFFMYYNRLDSCFIMDFRFKREYSTFLYIQKNYFLENGEISQCLTSFPVKNRSYLNDFKLMIENMCFPILRAEDDKGKLRIMEELIRALTIDQYENMIPLSNPNIREVELEPKINELVDFIVQNGFKGALSNDQIFWGIVLNRILLIGERLYDKKPKQVHESFFKFKEFYNSINSSSKPFENVVSFWKYLDSIKEDIISLIMKKLLLCAYFESLRKISFNGFCDQLFHHLLKSLTINFSESDECFDVSIRKVQDVISSIQNAAKCIENHPELINEYELFVYKSSSDFTNDMSYLKKAILDIEETLDSIYFHLENGLSKFMKECKGFSDYECLFLKYCTLIRNEYMFPKIIRDIELYVDYACSVLLSLKIDLNELQKQSITKIFQTKGFILNIPYSYQEQRARSIIEKINDLNNRTFGENWKNQSIFQRIWNLFIEIEHTISRIQIKKYHLEDELSQFNNIKMFSLDTNLNRNRIKCEFPKGLVNAYTTTRRIRNDTTENISKAYKVVKRYIVLSSSFRIIESQLMEVDSDLLMMNQSIIKCIYHTLNEGFQTPWTGEKSDYYIEIFSKLAIKIRKNIDYSKAFLFRFVEFLRMIEFTIDTCTLKETSFELVTSYDTIRKRNLEYKGSITKFLNEKVENMIRSRILFIIGTFFSCERNRSLIEIQITHEEELLSSSIFELKSKIFSDLNKLIEPYLMIHQFQNSDNSVSFFKMNSNVFDNIYTGFNCIFHKCESLLAYYYPLVQFSFFVNLDRLSEEVCDIESLYMNLFHYSELLKYIQSFLDEMRNEFIAISAQILKDKLIHKISNEIDHLKSTLNFHIQRSIEEIEKKSSSYEFNTIEMPKSSNEIAELVKTIKIIKLLYDHIVKTKITIENSREFCTASLLNRFESLFIKIFNHFNELNKIYSGNKGLFQDIVEKETEDIKKECNSIVMKWKSVVNYDFLSPLDAIKELTAFQIKLSDLTKHTEWINESRLGLVLHPYDFYVLNQIEIECSLLRNIWNHINTDIHPVLSRISVMKLSSIRIEIFRSELSTLFEKMESYEKKLFDLQPYQVYRDKISSFIRISPIIEGLISPAIFDRHWKRISMVLNKDLNISSCDINNILECNLEDQVNAILDVIRSAQGEFSLSKYMDDLESFWNSLEFELSNDSNLNTFVFKWEPISHSIIDNLNFLSSMQISPYFNVFKDQAFQWISKLNKVHNIIEDWSEAQRKYQYLEGVFSNPDIKSVLKQTSEQFLKCEKDFLKAVRIAKEKKQVLSVLLNDMISNILLSVNSGFNFIQKELSDYLENQRSSFPRFFFVGDEDLLEMIGKSSKVSEIHRHFTKMFEGICKIGISNGLITDMQSEEGEIVQFVKPFKLSSSIYLSLKNIESEMKSTLLESLLNAMPTIIDIIEKPSIEQTLCFLSSYPNQIILLSFMIYSTIKTNHAIECNTINDIKDIFKNFLVLLSELSSRIKNSVIFIKNQQLISECIHHRHVLSSLDCINSNNDFIWKQYLRYNINYELKTVIAYIGSSEIKYSFEYLGLCEFLVRTPLTDRVYLTLSQALYLKMGGSPFGPAGTGKTETVKNLGHHLGRHVLVFNCDETFDFKAMSRIFVGLCHCGSWGCFDEFNRLDEQMLSSISHQIQIIQNGLKQDICQVSILGKIAPLNPNVGIFITMNPGYAGRVELPDNLKQLFRAIAMNKPDNDIISEVLLFSNGFPDAERLSPKFVSIFSMASESLSKQKHYDFSLRSMKSVLNNASQQIREFFMLNKESQILSLTNQVSILVSSIYVSLFPKLLSDDIPIMEQIIQSVFKLPKDTLPSDKKLMEIIIKESELNGWTPNTEWVTKVIQLFDIQKIHHGFMLVGPPSTGKSSARSILMKSMAFLDGIEGQSYIINPKTITKDILFGYLDPQTREWNDGVFTRILRTIVNSQKNESTRRHWIIFDGDVDPEWVENLNSVLDDNKLLTLPNGERIALPNCVRIVFEVSDLAFATPATVSRCGIVFFSQDTVSYKQIVNYYFHSLSNYPIITNQHILSSDYSDLTQSYYLEKQKCIVDVVKESFIESIEYCHQVYQNIQNVFLEQISFVSLISSIFSIFIGFIASTIDNVRDSLFYQKAVVFSSFWGISSSLDHESILYIESQFISHYQSLIFNNSLLKVSLSLIKGDWEQNENDFIDEKNGFIFSRIQYIQKEIMKYVFYSGRPIFVQGKPGIGKKSLITSLFNDFPDISLIHIDLSGLSSIQYILHILESNCILSKSSNSFKMTPKKEGSFIHFSINDLNLPKYDKYNTSRICEFIRQTVESKGFWHPKKREWVFIERISFSILCTPLSFRGRLPISSRLVKHLSLFSFSSVSEKTLMNIINDNLNSIPYVDDSVQQFICQFYLSLSNTFNDSSYLFYSPSLKDLSLWLKSISCSSSAYNDFDSFLSVMKYEAHRVFCDRFGDDSDIEKFKELLNRSIESYFSVSLDNNDMLFSYCVSHSYQRYSFDSLSNSLNNGLRRYMEDNNNRSIYLSRETVANYVKIERCLQRSIPLIIVGNSGTGKNVLLSLVAWFNKASLFYLQSFSGYGLFDFEKDIKQVLLSSLKKTTYLIIRNDELYNNEIIERLNTLFCSHYIPGLFSGEEYSNLIKELEFLSKSNSIRHESEESLFNYFLSIVKENLKFVFLFNDVSIDLDHYENMIPSLLSRFSVLWINDWTTSSIQYFTKSILASKEIDISNSVIDFFISLYSSMKEFVSPYKGRNKYIGSPKHFFCFISMFCYILKTKGELLNSEKDHLVTGLKKLQETKQDVEKLKEDLAIKQNQLKEKELQAEKKLEEIMKDKEESVKKMADNQKIEEELIKSKVITTKETEKAQRELESVQVILDEAKSSVSKIKKANLDEIRRLTSPPEAIKVTLQAVYMLFRDDSCTWSSIRKFISSDVFIKSMTDYQISFEKIENIKKIEDLIRANDLSFEKANKASQACGPIFFWLNANIQYLRVHEASEPLRAKVRSLEMETLALAKKQNETKTQLERIEKSIKKMTSEYQQLILEQERTKNEANHVQSKLERSKNLLDSLSGETQRWKERNDTFHIEMENLIGHCLISSAFSTYCGILQQNEREFLLIDIMGRLDLVHIKYRDSFRFIDFISSPSQLILLHNNNLPKDDICIENALILQQNQERTPFIIDPSGNIPDFLMKMYPNSVKTSFIDPKFSKRLEACLRIGTYMIIEDAEQYDPIITPTLMRRFKKSAGRVLVDVKGNEVDYSSQFKMFLITKEIDYKPTSLISSYSIILNFSITSLSLRSLCLTHVLNHKLPDIEMKRQELYNSLSQMQVKIVSLESNMLDVFSNTKCDILENNDVLKLLEQIKTEAIDIENKVSETEQTLKTITETCNKYSPVADLATDLYFCLQEMSIIHPLYQFSIDFFWRVFDKTLVSDVTISQLLESVTKSLYIAASYSILDSHKLIIGFRFSQIVLKHRMVQIDDILIDYSLRGTSAMNDDPLFFQVLENPQIRADLETNNEPEIYLFNVLQRTSFSNNESVSRLMVLCLIRRIRPDRIIMAIKIFINSTLSFDANDSLNFDPEEQSADCNPTQPFILCTSPGYDPSSQIESYVSHKIISLAIGSSDTYKNIEDTIMESSKSPNWIIVKNVHLAPQWLKSFIKNISRADLHREFRLFFTSEINSKISASVYRCSRIIVFESSSGIKSNIKRLYSSELSKIDVPQSILPMIPQFLTLHSVLLERLRYLPIGWTKFYEFNDSDFRFSIQVCSKWLKSCNINEKDLTHTIERLLFSIVYSGRIDNNYDLRSLKSIISIILSKDLESEFNNNDLNQWIEQYKPSTIVNSIWIPTLSSKYIFVDQGLLSLKNILKTLFGTKDSASENSSSFTMGILHKWYDILNRTSLNSIECSESFTIRACLKNENLFLNQILSIISNDINDILNRIENHNQLSQKDRDIIYNLNMGIVPQCWNDLQMLYNDLDQWFDFLIQRVKFINKASIDNQYGRSFINLGMVRSPESLLFVTKQIASVQIGLSIEKLIPVLHFDSLDNLKPYEIVVCGLSLLSATWSNNQLVESSNVLNNLPSAILSWTEYGTDCGISVPCYTTKEKKKILFEVKLPCDQEKSMSWWEALSPSIIIR